jgi:AcrR family transcriptional regulator
MVTEVKSVDPRVKRTRQLLQQALLEVSREKSFASITVQDIAERATVNRATFYAHFEDKYELLDSIMRERFQREVTSKLSCGSKWGLSSLRALIEAVFDFLGEVHCQCQPSNRQFEPMFERAVQQELDKLFVGWL